LLRPILLLSALLLAVITVVPLGTTAAATPPPRSVVIVAASHSRDGVHDHGATARLLADLLNRVRVTPAVRPIVMDEKAASAPKALDAAQSVVLLGDEGPAHLLNVSALRANVAALVARRRGLVLVHGSAVPSAELEGDLRRWVGGLAYPEGVLAAVNWPAGFSELIAHPILKGLTPFSVDDRWLPARDKATGASALLQAEPPEYAHIDGKPDAQTMAWTYERPGGGRSFVYGGGHFLESYGSESVRRVLVNAVLWTAAIDGEAVTSD
jgi:hypothetical protein